ncbi:unnamed protein product, partial [marine sediment metagenome]
MTGERVIRRITHVDFEKRVAIAITSKGKEIRIPVNGQESWDAKIRKAKISLFPLAEGAIRRTYPQLLNPDGLDFWTTLKEEADFTEEKAVCLLRRHGYSVERTTREVVND